MPNIPSSMSPIPPDQPIEELADRFFDPQIFDSYSPEISFGEPTSREQFLSNYELLCSTETELINPFEVYHQWGFKITESQAQEKLELFIKAIS